MVTIVVFWLLYFRFCVCYGFVVVLLVIRFLGFAASCVLVVYFALIV